MENGSFVYFGLDSDGKDVYVRLSDISAITLSKSVINLYTSNTIFTLAAERCSPAALKLVEDLPK